MCDSVVTFHYKTWSLCLWYHSGKILFMWWWNCYCVACSWVMDCVSGLSIIIYPHLQRKKIGAHDIIVLCARIVFASVININLSRVVALGLDHLDRIWHIAQLLELLLFLLLTRALSLIIIILVLCYSSVYKIKYFFL